MPVSLNTFKDYCGLYIEETNPVTQATTITNKNAILKKFNVPSDSLLNLFLEQSKKICMSIIGNPSAIPDTETFNAGVYFLARYYLETRSKEQSQSTQAAAAPVFEEQIVNQGIDDIKVHKAVMRILTGMLSADREVTKFIPEVQT